MIKALNHVGISVADLERSLAFYRDAFGLQPGTPKRYEPGYYEGRYETVLGLPGATGRVVTLRSAALSVELFEFSRPQPQRSDPNRPVCDHGITHFCVEVTQIEAECERLQALGARFHCPPQTFGQTKVTYGRDPDGNVFELVEHGDNASAK